MRKLHWTRETIKLLGKVSDRQLAKRLKISAQAVSEKRRRLGIKRHGGSNRPEYRPMWGELELGLLRYPDKHVARLTGRSIAEIKAKRAERVNDF